MCGQGRDVKWDASCRGGVRDGDGDGVEEPGGEGLADEDVGGRRGVVVVGAEEM